MPGHRWKRIALAPFRRAFRWYHQVDWAKHTTVFAALLAAAGLALTAWGTVKSAQVADDQLTQSKEQRADDAKKQAALITMWAEPGITVIANRSLDPAEVFLRVRVLQAPDDRTASHSEMYLSVGAVPPCLQLDIPRRELSRTIQGNVKAPAAPRVDVLHMVVVDTFGNQWTRSVSGSLAPFAGSWGLLGASIAATQREILDPSLSGSLMALPSVKSKVLGQCGSGA